MEIRIINKNGEMVNLTNMATVTVSGNWLVGIDYSGESTRIERYESEEEAKNGLKGLIEKVIYYRSIGENDIFLVNKEEE